MSTPKIKRLHPVFWSLTILLLAQVLALIVVSREDSYLADINLTPPPGPPEEVILWPQPIVVPSGEVVEVQAYSSVGPIILYFLAVATIMGGVLFLIPVSKLTLVLKLVFTFLFAWSAFIILVFWLPLWATFATAAGIAAAWFFIRRVWLHNLVMLLAMVALGAVFGRLISPWTTMLIVAVIAVYDFLAVRSGYMIWMTEKLSDSDSLPAFIIPRKLSGWGHRLSHTNVKSLAKTAPSDRTEYILGGGDIGFSLLIMCSVYFTRNLSSAIAVAVFALAGLAAAYWIQSFFLKGKAMPALPPIAVLSIIGLFLTVGSPRF